MSRFTWGQAGVWRFIPAVSLVTVVCLLAAALAIAIYYESTYRTQSARELIAQAKVLGSAVAASLVFNDAATAQDYVNALEANPEIRAVGVYSEQGDLVASYSRSGAAIPTSPGLEAIQFDGDYLMVVEPVRQLGRQIGTIFVSAVTEPLFARITRYSVILLLALMAALAVIILTAAHSALARANNALLIQITEREKVEQALRQSQKMEALGQLSGGMAHDFNNLLTIIKTNLLLIERRLRRGDTEVYRFLNMAQEGVTRATAVTHRILAFSRSTPSNPKPLNLRHVFDELLPLLRNSVGSAIELNCTVTTDWQVFCDQNQFDTTLLNLMVNARDAMPGGGAIFVSAESHVHLSSDAVEMPAGDYIKLSVKDNGSGMSEDVRQKAMDPFFTTKPQGLGTGLGLSTTYGFIKQSGGYIQIESEIGKGTTITMFMPRFKEEAENAPRREPSKKASKEMR